MYLILFIIHTQRAIVHHPPFLISGQPTVGIVKNWKKLFEISPILNLCPAAFDVFRDFIVVSIPPEESIADINVNA